jgi:phospholipid/cholesterol/gamma-HCH transport system substrate-binding protein
MNKSRLEWKVGLFVFIGLVLLAALLIAFSKGASLVRNTYRLNLTAVNVGGLKPQASVLLAGVNVGSVSKIDLAKDGKSVKITLQIYQDYPIYSDARFVIESSGFLGDQYVSVIPMENKEPTLTNNASVNCQEPFNIQEVARSAAGFIKRLDETAKKLDASVSDLREKVLNAQTLSSFGASVTNLKYLTDEAVDTVHNINGLIATNGSQFTLAISNVLVFSDSLNVLADKAQTLLTTNGANITDATYNLDQISADIKQLTEDLQAGKGLAGTVLQNQQLATNFQQLAANLSVTSSNLNRLGVWGILWSHKPATTNANTATPKTKINRPVSPR